MPLYCYVITYYEWESQEHVPIFHERKFTKEEFERICRYAYVKTKNDWLKTHNYFYPNSDTVVEFLVKHYGFVKLDNTLVIFNVNDGKCGLRHDGDIDNHF